jgi:putative ABC transport system permease protein
MLLNHLTIALRNLSKNRLFTLLNLGGLSAGLAVSLLIGLYLRDELSFDAFHEKAERIHRVNFDSRIGGQEAHYAVSPAPMGPALLRDYPALEAVCRFRQWGFISMKKGEENIEEGPIVYADSTLFQVFSLPLLEGDPRTALADPKGLVISETIAQKYFGATTGVVGRTLRINDLQDVTVTGVLQKIPAQSHFQYDIVFPMGATEEGQSQVWLSNNFNTYLLLRPGASPEQFPAYFAELEKKYMIPQFEQMTGSSAADFAASGDYVRYGLQSLRDIHLHSDRAAEMGVNSDVKYVWIFGSVALMVLLLACVNFMNLSTARSAHRAREVGVRKALGSDRAMLMRQFLTESFLLTLLSFAVALLAVRLCLPAFNAFTEKEIALSLADAPLLAGLAALMLGTAVAAGSYPAFFLSAFRPIEALRGNMATAGRGGAHFRSALVVFQFFASVSLICSVLVVQQQLQFIQNKKLGWDKEHVVMLRNTWWLQQKTLDFKQKLLDIPGIERVSCADYFPTPSPRNTMMFTPEGADVATQSVASQFWEVDFDYLKTFGMRILRGRDFDPNLANDSAACVINEAAARAFGWDDPMGRKVTTFEPPDLKQRIEMRVVGVVENFHSESLRESIEPLVMAIGRSSGTMALRFAPNADVEKTLASVGQLYKTYLPGKPFNYRFLDDEFDKQYRAEQRIGGILGAFAGFAIFIACLGLFGLAAFVAEQRTKEVGIRKVLGASLGAVVSLLSKDFLKLVVASFVIAFPVAYFFMQKWLADFAYRIDIQWWMFAAAGAAAVGIAFLTVGSQAVRAALANPVKSLRSE